MTQEQCESAVKALQDAGHYASHVMGAPDDHGVWIEVWNNDLGACHEFRIHDEEIVWWSTLPPLKTQTKDK
tara:strand:- start:801 stop:1013 length:213 start_codon:yes stop_codon:yes gene_type:complete